MNQFSTFAPCGTGKGAGLLSVSFLDPNELAAFSREHHVFAALGFDTPADGPWPHARLAMPCLGHAPKVEVWSSPDPVSYLLDKDIFLAHDGRILCGLLRYPGGEGLDSRTFDAYQRIFSVCRVLGFPHLFRIWNYVPQINAFDQQQLEHYRAFCKGRARAFEAMGFADSLMPAGTGVGCTGNEVVIFFMACVQPNQLNLENPRQMPAYRYPDCYGPKSPSFARATLLRGGSGADLYVSGTSSIIDHETVHQGDVVQQCETALDNIALLVGKANLARYQIDMHAALADLRATKVYVRRDADLAAVEAVCRRRISGPLIFLRADICREDLLVEIEGYFTASEAS